MVAESEFRLVDSLEIGRLKKVKWLEDPDTKQIGIAKGNRLVAWVMYDFREGRALVVKYVWTSKNPLLVREFKKKFEVTPAMFFAEHFIRKGATKFATSKLFDSGARFALRLERNGLTTRSTSLLHPHVFKFSSKWQSLAQSRKHTPK